MHLEGDLLGVSVGLVSLAIVLWVYQRVVLHFFLREWRYETYKLEHLQNLLVDEVRDHQTRLKLLELRRESYLEIAQPLEPYVVRCSHRVCILTQIWI